MTQYFTVIDGNGRRGPFPSIGTACRLLRQTSKERGYSDKRAHHFFLFESAVEQVDTLNGKTVCFRLGWLTRETFGRIDEPPELEGGAFTAAACNEAEESGSRPKPELANTSSLRITGRQQKIQGWP